MRIAVTNWSCRKVGGVETYLNATLQALHQNGHEVAFWYEMDEPTEREKIAIPPQIKTWCVRELGTARALAGLRAWQPDVIYSHKFHDPDLEAQVQRFAPSVFFAHDYYGTCISGLKTFQFPVAQPCQHQFGWQCLLHYFPHRCGGHSPVTMLKLYQLQSKRLAALHRYDAIATHSEHMGLELKWNGITVERVHSFPYFVKPVGQAEGEEAEGAQCLTACADSSRCRLLFSGRMESLKGGQVLLDALPHVLARLDKLIRLTFVGDGRERAKLEREAKRLQSLHERLEIEFTGWLKQEQIKDWLNQSDLLIVPSIWPEPFGLVGPEAGLYGVPVAAFAVGGIVDWLKEGINGALAPGNPPTPSGLAEAIVRCLHDPAIHARMRRGAVEIAQQFNLKEHLDSLMRVFERAIEHYRRTTRIA